MSEQTTPPNMLTDEERASLDWCRRHGGGVIVPLHAQYHIRLVCDALDRLSRAADAGGRCAKCGE